MDYMETGDFKILYKERYKIEVKNIKLKNNYDYRNISACGKLGILYKGQLCFF